MAPSIIIHTNGQLTGCTVGDDNEVDGLNLFEDRRISFLFPPSGFFEFLDIISDQDVELVGNGREPLWSNVSE